MTDRAYFRPVLPLLVALMAGIAAGTGYPGHGTAAWGLAGLCLAALGCCLWIAAVRRSKAYGALAGSAPLLLFLALGYLSIQPWTAPDLPANHVSRFTDARPWEITGRVAEAPPVRAGRQRLILIAEKLSRGTHTLTVSGNIRVTVGGPGPILSCGDRITLRGRLRAIRNFNNPGGFDYRRHMAFQQIWCSAYTRGSQVVRQSPADLPAPVRYLTDLRQGLSDRIDAAAPERSRPVLKALLIGDRNGLSPALRRIFNRTGTGHLLAISGLHMGIVATVAFFLFTRLLSRSRSLLMAAGTRKLAALFSFLPVLAYAVVAGLSPSTQRAVIMICVFLLTFWVERETDAVNTLAIAAFLILLFFPPAFFAISFQLSFSAVLSIVLGLPLLTRILPGFQGPAKRLLRRLLLFLGVTLLATLGTLPLIMYYFHQVSLVGLAANLIAVPLIGFIAVPLGLTAVFTHSLIPGAATLALSVAGAAVDQALSFLAALAARSFAAAATVSPSMFEIICYYLLLLAVVTFRKTVWARVGVVVCLVALGVDGAYWVHHRFANDTFRVTVLDVGQGSAALLEFPDGYRTLIDGGGFSDNSTFDVGRNIIAPLLWRKKIKTVDSLILSHPNADHLNGLLYIAEHFNVKTVWSNNETAATTGYRRFLEIIEKKKIRHPDFRTLLGRTRINGVTVEVLYPPAGFARQKAPWRSLNNNSVVVRCTFGRHSILFPGDIQAEAEQELVRMADTALKSTVLLAPHHGSRSSSTPRFLACTGPSYVIISAGWQNRYHFPHPSVLKRYEDLGCRIYRTDCNGAVTVTTDGQTLEIKTFMGGEGLKDEGRETGIRKENTGYRQEEAEG